MGTLDELCSGDESPYDVRLFLYMVGGVGVGAFEDVSSGDESGPYELRGFGRYTMDVYGSMACRVRYGGPLTRTSASTPSSSSLISSS